MTDFLDTKDGRIAYDVTGQGPLIVLSHGIGDRRQVFRFLAPELVAAGFRVAAADMRGHGESSTGDWKSISRTEDGVQPPRTPTGPTPRPRARQSSPRCRLDSAAPR